MSDITQVQPVVASAFSSQNSPVISLGSVPPVGSLILLAAVANENSGAVNVTTPPTGFTLATQDEVVNGVRVWVYSKVAGAAESASAQIFFNRNACVALMIANYQGGNVANWIDVLTSNHGNSVNPDTGSIPTHAITSEFWVAFLGTQYPDVFDTPTNSFSIAVNNNKNPGAGNESVTYGMFTRDLAAPSLGPATMSAHIANARNWAGIIIALQGAGVAYTVAPTGGLVLGGSVVPAVSRDVAPTSGVVLGGAVALEIVRAFAPSAGLVLGGSISDTRILALTRSGGVALGGTCATTRIGPLSLIARLYSGTTLIASWTHPLNGSRARVSWARLQAPLVPGLIYTFGKAKLILRTKEYLYEASTGGITFGKARLVLKGKPFQAIRPSQVDMLKPRLVLKGKPYTLRQTQRYVIGKPKLILRAKTIARAGQPGLVPSAPLALTLTPSAAVGGALLVPTADQHLTLAPTAPGADADLVPTVPQSTLLVPTAKKGV